MGGSHDRDDLKASNIILGTYRVLHCSTYLMVSLLVACKATKNGSSDGVVMFEKKKKDLWFSIWWGFVFLFGNLDDTIALRWTARVAHV